MGAKDSKRSCLIYEDAVKRMSDVEFKRVCEAFKRLTNGGQLLSQQCFAQHVLGDGVPPPIVQRLYVACGGTQRGIGLRDLICGLVLLTKGTQDEKIKFLWTLYCNDSSTQVTRAEFQAALQAEGRPAPTWDHTLKSLFGIGQDKVGFEDFKVWIKYNREATVLSKWLLSNPCVTLSSEVETPTFYQTLAGVTHLEEQDICELEKCFWTIQGASVTGNLDFHCLTSLVCPPVPIKACKGLFLALDVNQDDHVDFKELCCGISAACRGPMAERMKFCFKIFDMDRDLYLNSSELEDMKQTLKFIANENKLTYAPQYCHEPPHTAIDRDAGAKDNILDKTLDVLNDKVDGDGGLSQEDFLVWAVQDNSLIAPLLELLFQVCHVSLGLKPHCRHNEYEIVMGWLEREERRGFHVGQFWYLVSSEWWQHWVNYTTAPRTSVDHCQCRADGRGTVEEGIICDESLISNTTDYASTNNDCNSNSMESMGELFSRLDSCSIASSSGVSSSSGTASKRAVTPPGPIDNSCLVAEPAFKVATLTGEGGRLKRDTPLVQRRDFELVPDSLWKALSLWYGGPLPLPRQVIKPPGRSEVELELFPLNLRILRHQVAQTTNGSTPWSSVVGGYGAALSTAGLAPASSPSQIRRSLVHVAAFSRLATVQQVTDFLCERLNLKPEDARLWLLRDHQPPSLLDDDRAMLQDMGVRDADQLLLEVRNKDLTWPEELDQLAAGAGGDHALIERRMTLSLPPGATGLQNLGNTCFMNAALQAVSNTRPLTMYFQQDVQLLELNSENPQGTKGFVAKRYAELCRELWTGSTRSLAPLKLRHCVSKYAPQLSGGGQHDSQELLAWLLDALHEDLNRVASKQYTQLRDSDGRPDEIVAEEAWQQHLKREHSIITDLFHGQLKSKVTCRTCGHESVKFDPFNHLSLPLPMENYNLCEVLVVRLDGGGPIKYGLRLNSDAKYGELKERLSELCDVDPSRLLLVEVASCQVKELLPDDAKINAATATELYAYELPVESDVVENDADNDTDVDAGASDSPLARSPEVRSGSAICMPNILCFKKSKSDAQAQSKNIPLKRPVPPVHSVNSSTVSGAFKPPSYLVAVHRKCVLQETYFLSQQKSKPSLFGMPLLLGCSPRATCRDAYDMVWGQVTRLLSPLPQSDQTNHAQDCDDSLGYEFPFQLKAVLAGGQICAVCNWTRFCRGCPLPCSDEPLFDRCGRNNGTSQTTYIAIDWDPTALHLRYQSSREKLWTEHESVAICRKLHTEPIDLDYCLRAFTSEERLEAKYHCSSCNNLQPATKKLQIWRLPPILIVHLKRFDYVNDKWVKTQKVVNFPFKDFDPTAYLASVPQETIIRHKQLLEEKRRTGETQADDAIPEDTCETPNSSGRNSVQESTKLLEGDESVAAPARNNGAGDDRTSTSPRPQKCSKQTRSRLISTSLLKTPIIDEHLKDYHEHKLLPGQDPFDLKYQLYAVVSHSGMLNGGHYISYACNPNGNWYCYNDSSCREVVPDPELSRSNLSLDSSRGGSSGCTPLSRRKNTQQPPARRPSTGSTESDQAAPLATQETEQQGGEERCVFSPVPTRRRSAGTRPSPPRECEAFQPPPAGCGEVANGFRCPYNSAKIPKIDTSSAYILFYERSGLDYRPYLPKVTAVTEGGERAGRREDLDECDGDLQTNGARLVPEKSPILKWFKEKFTT
ncbi:ubiquitin carboxyl-terminal hydrolase 32 isoform X2 [Cylas formicarius]|uniref:ubiquitin carboxyl-terminal hydrolase 32 isoform X2 n=1 Tax=Cylas formicarius TaxID=197179 RepID=UPI0029589AFE|nr:ubiquitin carboxyl-terminal hydrolase 32 isoform X2 [Cylas formicarius]